MSRPSLSLDHHTHRGRRASSTRPTTTEVPPPPHDQESAPEAVAIPSPTPRASASVTRSPRLTPRPAKLLHHVQIGHDTTLPPRSSRKRRASVPPGDSFDAKVDRARLPACALGQERLLPGRFDATTCQTEPAFARCFAHGSRTPATCQRGGPIVSSSPPPCCAASRSPRHAVPASNLDYSSLGARQQVGSTKVPAW
jgi:hypothetical protein